MDPHTRKACKENTQLCMNSHGTTEWKLKSKAAESPVKERPCHITYLFPLRSIYTRPPERTGLGMSESSFLIDKVTITEIGWLAKNVKPVQ